MEERGTRALFIGIGGDSFTKDVIKDLRLSGDVSFAAGVIDENQSHQSFDHVAAYFSQCLFADYDWSEVSQLSVDDVLYQQIAHAEGNLLRQMDRLIYEPLAVDRKVPFTGTFDERRALMFNHLRYWDRKLSDLRIEVVIFHNVPHQVFDTIIYCLARARMLPTLIFNTVGAFHETVFSAETIEELGCLDFGLSLRTNASETLQDYPNRIFQDWQRVCNALNGEFSQKTSTRRYSLFASLANDGHIGGQNLSRTVLLRAIRRRIARFGLISSLNPASRWRTIRRIRGVRRTRREELRSSINVIPDATFLYFPLHFQPEATTSAKGRHYVEQEEVVQAVAEALPHGALLVLKEHPHQFEKLLPRARNYYSRLTKHPQVVLISSDVSSTELRQRCSAVITVSGSNGFEVLASGKPVMAFGSAPWREAPGVFTIRSKADIGHAVSEIFSSDVRPSASYDQFLARLRDSTFRGDLSGPNFEHAGGDIPDIGRATQHNLRVIITSWLKTRSQTASGFSSAPRR